MVIVVFDLSYEIFGEVHAPALFCGCEILFYDMIDSWRYVVSIWLMGRELRLNWMPKGLQSKKVVGQINLRSVLG